MNPTFHFNFIGLCLQDFPSGAQFYTDQLGIEPKMTHPDSPGWMMLLDSWRDSAPIQKSSASEQFRSQRMSRRNKRGNMAQPGGRSRSSRTSRPKKQKLVIRGMLVELFTAKLPDGWTSTDFEQAGRLSVFASLQDVSRFTDSIMGTIEGVEGVTWQVWAEENQAEPWKARGARLRCVDMQAQMEFYQNAFGWNGSTTSDTSGKLLQGEGMPTLDLTQEEGLSPLALPAEGNPLRVTPSWMSIETSDIQVAQAKFQDLNLTILRPATQHAWGGTDIVLADPDGNPVQVVQQDTHPRT
jgi:predicted enzyme related to lactoylglutathione lyase